MTLNASRSDEEIPVEKPLHFADGVHPELESALIEGLSDAPAASPENPGQADLPDVQEPAGEIDAESEAALLDGLSDGPPVPKEEHGGSPTSPEEAGPELAEPAGELDAEFEAALLEGLSTSPDESNPPDPSDAPPVGGAAAGTGESVSGADMDFANALLEIFSESPQTSSDDPGPSDLPAAPASMAAPHEAPSGPEMSVPDDAPAQGIDAAPADSFGERMPDGPAAALAFAMDRETEEALREGLLHFEAPTPDCVDPQVWPGGLRAAVAALAEGHSTRLVIVDIDGIPYPAGAIHELADVCEIGTVVIAVGSDDSARANREILQAGVSDYLVKPVAAAAVRQAAAHATAADRDSPITGCVAGFAGTGGSGTTTVAAATAFHAASQGRYVSILDLNRTVPAMALLLDVEPSAGLDQLFDVAGRIPPDPQMLDGVRTERSERISLYAYRPGVTPPPVAALPALDWVLDQLRRRSQLVLVDGLDDPQTHLALLEKVDTRVLVVEPTVVGTVRAARLLGLIGAGAPPLLVQNHTRQFKSEIGAKLLLNAGVDTPPDVVIPFEATLPELADRGWPRGRLPRRLRKPIAELADRVPSQVATGRPAFAALSREA